MSRGPGAVQRHIMDILADSVTPATPGGRLLTVEELRALWHSRLSPDSPLQAEVDTVSEDQLRRITPVRFQYERGAVPRPATRPWVTLRDMVGDDAPAAKVESYRRAIHKLAAAGKVETTLMTCEVPVRNNSRWLPNPVSMLPREVLAARLPVADLDGTADIGA